ncbi:MAG: SDR family oxidoreductase [Clostridiales bacterium]|nr:SDR family oxidoreductase [Clostridiales bacterium]
MKDVSVITGGCGGMGFATAAVLGRHGGAVLLCDTKEESLKESVEILKRQNIDAHGIAVDVTNVEQVKAAAEKAAALGTIKNIFHTAGISPIIVAKLDPAAGADAIMRVNALGTLNVLENFYPVLGKRGGSVVCLTSSSNYLMPVVPDSMKDVFDSVISDREHIEEKLLLLSGGQPGRAYMFSKLFAKRYCDMNLGRFGKKGWRINTIAPGRILTPMHCALIEAEPDRIAGEIATMPLGRYGNAYEIANLVDFLCSADGAYINGIDILVDDGTQAFTTVPQIAD